MKLNRKVENKTQKVTHKFNGFPFQHKSFHSLLAHIKPSTTHYL